MAKNRIIAIDPGTTESGFVLLDGQNLREFGILPNGQIRLNLLGHWRDFSHELAIEMIASYGMAVGESTFETCVWIGRMIEAFMPGNHHFIYRKDVKIHLCGSMRAKDTNIRQAIMDRYGSEKSVAIGTKKQPGKLYGVKKHIWSALAVGITYKEKHETPC